MRAIGYVVTAKGENTGLVPDVAVAPTLQGIRNGKDEVLERAIRYVNEGK